MNRGRPREFDKHEALQSAMLVFWKKGYRNTSIEDLTEALEISRPSLYAAFGDKEALFQAALNRYVADHGESIAAELDTSPNIVDAIAAFLRASVDIFANKSLPGGCLIAMHATDTELQENVRARLMEMSGLTEDMLTKRFQVAFRDGQICENQSAKQLAALTFCVLVGLSHGARTGASRRKLNEIVTNFVQVLANLID